MVETFLKTNCKPRDLHNNYVWVGKCRTGSKDKGGIGICVNSRLKILDENLIDSRDDGFERLWILCRMNNVKTAVGVVYFPNDGVDKPTTDKLFYELLENCSVFRRLGYEICLTGDFNGKCLSKCDFTGKTLVTDIKQSYNGVRLRQFSETVNLEIANSMNCCEGFYTRVLNNQKSAIDYILLSEALCNHVKSVFIDELGSLHLHSDHVIVRIRLRKQRDDVNKRRNPTRLMWKTENVDWDKFKVNIDNVFDEHWHEASNDINVLWDIWKAKVNYAADMVMKKVPFVKNYRNFWDKPLDRMLKSRRDANRLQRLHNRTRNHDSQLGTHISGVYKKRKLALHEAIKRKEFDRKVKCLTVKGIATNKNSKFFWKLLRGPKESVNPSRIIDPNNKDDFIEDDADISECLKTHFSKIGKDTTTKPDFKNHVTNLLSEIESNRGRGENLLSVTFSSDSISDVLRWIQLGKAPGFDEIPNEFLKYGGDTMVKTLCDLFTFISDHEQIPVEWQRGIIKPLHKSGSVYDLDNYRGITLSSNVYKLFSKTLEIYIVNFLEQHKVLGENQGAFRKDRRIEDKIFAL